MRNAANKSVWRKKDCFWLPLNKDAMDIWLSSLRIRAHLSWRTGKHLHVPHVLQTYSTCSYPGYQDTTTYAALLVWSWWFMNIEWYSATPSQVFVSGRTAIDQAGGWTGPRATTWSAWRQKLAKVQLFDKVGTRQIFEALISRRILCNPSILIRPGYGYRLKWQAQQFQTCLSSSHINIFCQCLASGIK